MRGESINWGIKEILRDRNLSTRLSELQALIEFVGRKEAGYEDYKGRYTAAEVLKVASLFYYFLHEQDAYPLSEELKKKIKKLFKSGVVDVRDLLVHIDRRLPYEPLSLEDTRKIKEVLQAVAQELVELNGA